MSEEKRETWPVLTQYDQDHLTRIALPLGGIGTGTVSLGGRGDLRDWEIMNRPAKGFAPKDTFFAIYVQGGGDSPAVRALEGPLEPHEYEGVWGSRTPNHSLPRFRTASFQAAYPLGNVNLSDPDVPVDIIIEGFNPFVGADIDISSIPTAILRFVISNKTDKPLQVSVCGSLNNFIGTDGGGGAPSKNLNEFRRSEGVQGLFMSSYGVKESAEGFGTMALATTSDTGVSHRTAWANRTWSDSLLDFWDDFSADGSLEDRALDGVDDPTASLCVNTEIAPHGSESVTFLIAWHFPNRITWTPQAEASTDCGCDDGECATDPNRIGNYYTTQYEDAWDVAVKTAASLNNLESRTVEFVKTFCASDLPQVAKEAALYNLSTLRTQTCFRTEDGMFYGWEGCDDDKGCCLGSCTHVWNYEQATAFLFGELAAKMREVEFTHATDDRGHMSFRTHLPLGHALDLGTAAADGQMGCLIKLYRDWQLSGDDEALKRLWPKARKALEFCWIPGGWDADKDGVMEGCQHNTMDVEYYGPNPQMGIWYLGALRSAQEMAEYLGESEFAATCRDVFNSGSAWLDANLFNGEYYEHEIRPPKTADAIAVGLRHMRKGYVNIMGAKDLEDPELQLGAGCLVDQLVGQFLAHVCGLGYLVEEKNVKTTLDSIMNFNFKEGFYDHFNHHRSYVLNDESALLMATYPRGRRPVRPFPYFNEVMTGFEYTAAIGMLYEGKTEEGLKCIKAIRDRYDGKKRNPFDEAECGHHYARAMASWATILALTGFRYSGVEKSMTLAPKDGVHFWSNGYAWGTCEQKSNNGGVDVELTVGHGELNLSRFELKEYGEVSFDTAQIIKEKETASWHIKNEGRIG